MNSTSFFQGSQRIVQGCKLPIGERVLTLIDDDTTLGNIKDVPDTEQVEVLLSTIMTMHDNDKEDLGAVWTVGANVLMPLKEEILEFRKKDHSGCSHDDMDIVFDGVRNLAYVLQKFSKDYSLDVQHVLDTRDIPDALVPVGSNGSVLANVGYNENKRYTYAALIMASALLGDLFGADTAPSVRKRMNSADRFASKVMSAPASKARNAR